MGNSLPIQNIGVVDCYNVSLENTGEFQYSIFSSSISNLSIGDEIGIFDLEGQTIYDPYEVVIDEDGNEESDDNCANELGELLVGAGTWTGNQLEIESIGSVNLCAFGGPQLAGFVGGNDVIIRVYKPSEGIIYNTELVWEVGTGKFGDILQQITEINLTNPSLSKSSF